MKHPRMHNQLSASAQIVVSVTALLAVALVAGLVLIGSTPDQARAQTASAGLRASGGAIEPGAGSWSTWVLASGSELRLAAPPGDGETQAEVAELQDLASRRDAAALNRISYWDAGAPSYRWTERAVKHTQSKGAVAMRAERMLTLLNVAIYDGMVAAWDSKYAHNRARPSERSPALSTAIAAPKSPSYPDEHAVAAGAAATILAYVFPADADMFAALADEAARSRLEAGVAYPSDVTAGLALGRQVGERVAAWGRDDGADAVWTGSVPTEPGMWTGTNPAEPLGGSWKPWVLESGSQFRPGPRPALDSQQMRLELDEVKNYYPRTNLTNLTASYWEYYGGRGAFEYWNDQVAKKVFEYRLDSNAPQAARVYALVNVASHDAMIACWDAKYTYWAPRPQMVDPTITTVFATPNHPSYPSAHSCWSGAAGATLGRLFPRETLYFDGLAEQAGEARIMGGIHFRTDLDVGLQLGRQVAEVAWSHARITESR